LNQLSIEDWKWHIQQIFGNYSGLPLSTGAKKRAVTVMTAPLQSKQRVRGERRCGYGCRQREGQEDAGAPCAEAK